MRWPATPAASSRSRISSVDSVAAAQSSVRPAARIAPHGLGPRVAQLVAQSPALGRLEPAAETETRRGHDQVGFQPDAGGGRGVQRLVVGQRHDRDRGRGDDPRATTGEQRGHLVAPPFGGDGDGEARQHTLSHRLPHQFASARVPRAGYRDVVVMFRGR
jgi:hypothetical protein